ncbi:SelB C-terminal domain-containing protein [Acidobacteriota bacterium]
MKTSIFDAVVEIILPKKVQTHDATFVVKKEKVPGSFSFYETKIANSKESFIAVSLSKPKTLKWGYSFDVLSPGSEKVLGKGKILYPADHKPIGRESKKRANLLPQLRGEKIEMLAILAREKGLMGLREKEILEFAPFTRKTLLPLCEKLEAEGLIRILSFTPMFLLFQGSFEFLCEKITLFIRRHHETHSDEPGVPVNEVRQKFDLPDRIWFLALKHLIREKQIKEVDKRLSAIDYELSLTKEEESLLDRLEEMCLEGKLHSVSMEDLQRRFNLSARRLQILLSFLAERRKIVQGEDGFILHSHWLEELVAKIRDLEGKELSVGQFKEITGLSRKYAIPLLELLDQMKVTRRRGATREIL